MLTIIQLIFILALGYLSAHFLIGKLQSKFFFISGIEYIILGVLIGPHVTNIMTPDVVNQLSPVMSLSLGSLGLLYGLQLRFRELGRGDSESYRLTFIEVLVTFLLISGAFALLFWHPLAGKGDWMAVFSGALALGATAAVSAPTAIHVTRQHYKAKGKISDRLQFVVGFDQLLGIIFFGLIFCFLHVGQTSGIRPLTTTEWAAVNIGFGIILGILFFLFLGREESSNLLLLALLGIVVFASGAAYYLNLSPIFTNLLLGIMLANTSKIRGRLVEVLQSIEKPVSVVILVVAGAAWNLSSLADRWQLFLVLAGLYLLLRYMGKLFGGYIAYTTSENPELLPRRVGLGLLSQGGVAVAMIVNYRQVYKNDFTDIVVTCVLISVIIYEFLSPKLTKDILIDVNEIQVTR
jgi:Kef-type K+ transport system membrane component KefB